MGAQRVNDDQLLYYDGNTDLIIFNTSLTKTNIYLEGVAMFSLFFHKLNKLDNKYSKSKNINLNITK